MRLQQIIPPLQENLLQALLEIGVNTDVDLLLTQDPLSIFAKLPAGHGVTLHAFHETLARIAGNASATPTYGDKLLQQDLKRKEDIFGDDMLLGVPEVDALVGGFSPPHVFELSGDAGSGKTALALQLAVRQLSRVGDCSVLWIDSNGDFSPERVSLLLEQVGGDYTSTALERLQISLAFDIEAVHVVLETLRQSLSSPPGQTQVASAASPLTRCIVIDSITSLLGPMLSATSSQGHAIMTTFMRQLRALADLFSLTVIVINNSTKVGIKTPNMKNPESVFETARKPALGPTFTFVTDTTIWLSRRMPEGSENDGESTMHIAEVFRSRLARSRTWARFKIKAGCLMSA